MRNEANKTIIKFAQFEKPMMQFQKLGILDGFYYATNAFIKVCDGYAVRLCDMKTIPFGNEASVEPRQLTITVS